MKTEMLVCPKCGSEDTLVSDTWFCGGQLEAKVYCECCEYAWYEFFTLKYDGYNDTTGDYNAKGEAI